MVQIVCKLNWSIFNFFSIDFNSKTVILSPIIFKTSLIYYDDSNILIILGNLIKKYDKESSNKPSSPITSIGNIVMKISRKMENDRFRIKTLHKFGSGTPSLLTCTTKSWENLSNIKIISNVSRDERSCFRSLP